MSVSTAFVPEQGHPAPEPFGYRPLAAIAAAAAGGVPQKRIGRILTELAPDLIAMHEQGQVHGAISVHTVGMDEFGYAHLMVPPLYPDSPGAIERASCFTAAEQFDPEPERACGPWTDVYGLSAVVCSLISGSPPPHALARRADDHYAALAARKPRGYDESFLAAVDRGLSVVPAHRPQSLAEFYAALGIPYVPDAAAAPLIAAAGPSFGAAANDAAEQSGAPGDGRRRTATALAVAAGVLAVAGIWTWMGMDDTTEAVSPGRILPAVREPIAQGPGLGTTFSAPSGTPSTTASEGLPSRDGGSASSAGIPAGRLAPDAAPAGIPADRDTSPIASAPQSASPAVKDGNASPPAVAGAPETMPDKPARPATVRVNADIRPWGEIFVDGVSRGVSPPLKTLTLPAGRHTVVVRNADLAPYRIVLDLKPGQVITLQHVFR
jgi:hypothetical protein